MPRRTRMYLAGLPYHLVQRGNNRAICFIEPENYQFYLELWQKAACRYGVAVHAYCLMTNHIHFLVTPEQESSISSTMKVVGSHYAQYINRKYKRTGTLWEGRHRSSLVQTEKYLLSCYRYIELNPVRAGMVERPEDYRWSSYKLNTCDDKGWIVPHDEYLRLGDSPQTRQQAYRELFTCQITARHVQLIRKAAHYSLPVADPRFCQQIEERYGIQIGQMRPGRPCKRGRRS